MRGSSWTLVYGTDYGGYGPCVDLTLPLFPLLFIKGRDGVRSRREDMRLDGSGWRLWTDGW